MKVARFFQGKQFQLSRFWLVAIAAGLAAANLTIAFHGGKQGFLAFSFLFWAAAGSVFWDKHEQLCLGSGLISATTGATLILAMLFLGVAQPGDGVFACAPFVSVLGLALMASGRRGLGQYRQELIILLALGLPKLLLPSLPDISPLTAKFAAFTLWYTGFPVSLQGVHILLPAGGVEVVPSCSGLNLICYMLGIAAIFLVMFPTARFQKWVAPIVAMAMGFLVNGLRIAMLAALSGYSPDLFDYFHNRGGSLFFVTVSVMLFGIYCWFSISWSTPPTSPTSLNPPNPPTSPNPLNPLNLPAIQTFAQATGRSRASKRAFPLSQPLVKDARSENLAKRGLASSSNCRSRLESLKLRDRAEQGNDGEDNIPKQSLATSQRSLIKLLIKLLIKK